jgi:hypothetical protein
VLSPISLPLTKLISLRKIKLSASPPCGLHCNDCSRFTGGECLGCPGTTLYKGTRSIITLGLDLDRTRLRIP